MNKRPCLLYGLIGYPLGHSFSAVYFEEKFKKLGIHAEYRLFPIEDISFLPSLIQSFNLLMGFNVTIPYKQSIISYLDELSEDAESIGAVNAVRIKVSCQGKTTLAGYNTDWQGFLDSLNNFITGKIPDALILGSGGSSRAVAYALKKSGINYRIVSRTADQERISYNQISEELLKKYPLVINTTPCGMFPNTLSMPSFPVEFLGPDNYVFDLIYNPGTTLLMEKAAANGAVVQNGLDMLHRQAELSYEIWRQ